MIYQCTDSVDLQSQLIKAGDKLVVVNFYNAFCGHSKKISPKLEEMQQTMTNVKFLKVDIDEVEGAALEYM